MKKNIVLLFVMLFCFNFIGCSKNYIGSYYERNHPNSGIDIKSDGTFYIYGVKENSGVSGTYKEVDDHIYLKGNGNESTEIRFKISGKHLIADNGDTLTKK
jgi:hypothetical protein